MGDLPSKFRTLARELGLSSAAQEEIDRLVAAHLGRRGAMPTTEVQPATMLPAGTVPETLPPPPGDLVNPAPAEPWERYEDLGSIGRGGMGEVRRVRDRVMGRVLAMKLLPHDIADAPGARARFLAEARLTASLQHPGIVPVHDCGALPDGRLWFTMKEVRGTTLRDVIEALHSGGFRPLSPSSLRRVVDAYLRACEAMAYAHGQGVLHRDLKPDNIMIGEFGEVLVVDWGIGRLFTAPAEPTEAGPISERSFRHTQAGQVVGTPAYMPPEQARGALDGLGPASDVYALGAILYEILCGKAPYDGMSVAIWAQVLQGPPKPVAERARFPLPPDLVAVCERAMARAPEERFPDARVLAEEVRSVLDGARRRDRALALIATAEALAPKVAALREEASALRAEAHARLAELETFDPAEKKALAWALEDRARALERTASVEEVAWHQALRSALNEAPDLVEAHAALADVHLAELCAAEAARDADAAARAEALLRLHDRGRHAALLRGDGALTLHTDPAGAEVWLFRFVERQRRLVAEPAGLLGRTPLDAVTLPRGSYLLRLRAPGRREVSYPVFIGRGEHWDGIRPGGSAPFPVPLLPEDALDDGDVYVPPGWFLSGGDPAAAESLPARRLWVDGFILRRHPVTQAEYLAFLNALVAEGREAEAAAACPRLPRSLAGSADVPIFTRDADGRFHLGPLVGDARHPVASIDWHGAMAYAAWEAARTGRPFRLPGELEREKAARGVDGRFLPWGDQLEPTWACMVGSRPGAPSLATIDAYPTDESPYGARGLAGNVRDWCVDAWTAPGPPVVEGVVQIVPASASDPSLRSIRGGAWLTPPQLCRAAGRFAAAPGDRVAGVGLRLARPLARGQLWAM